MKLSDENNIAADGSNVEGGNKYILEHFNGCGINQQGCYQPIIGKVSTLLKLTKEMLVYTVSH